MGRRPRLGQLVEANVLGTHAFQVALARKGGKGDPACYSPGSLTAAQLAALETHQAALLKADVKEVRAWADGQPSAFDPRADLEPLLASGLRLADGLPVEVFTRWLAGRTKARSVAQRLGNGSWTDNGGPFGTGHHTLFARSRSRGHTGSGHWRAEHGGQTGVPKGGMR